MQEVFGMPASRLIVPPNEKYGKFVLNEVLEAGNFGRHDARNRFGRSQLGHNLQRIYRDMRLVKFFLQKLFVNHCSVLGTSSGG